MVSQSGPLHTKIMRFFFFFESQQSTRDAFNFGNKYGENEGKSKNKSQGMILFN
jgi:hypothetical protein